MSEINAINSFDIRYLIDNLNNKNMINKWILNNFKSINKETELEFRPLTIFTGANSSGKSTVLQSILLVTQTLQNPIASRSVVLNGRIKKFGSYSDIVYGRDHSLNLKIGFALKNEDNEEERYWGRNVMNIRLGRQMKMFPSLFDFEQITECEFVVSSADKSDNLQPEMESTHICVRNSERELDSIEIAKWEKRSDIEEKVYQTLRGKNIDSELNYTIKNASSVIRRHYMDDDIWKPIGVSFNHFLPEYMIGYCSKADQMRVRLREYLQIGTPYFYNIEEHEKEIIPLIQDKAMAIVEQLYSKYSNDNSRKNVDKTYNGIRKKFTLNRLKRMLSACALDEEKHKYITQIVEKLNVLSEEYLNEPIPLHHRIGIEGIKDFFCKRINYLGPLREEPRSLYPLSNVGSTTEVGLRGENTAAVYFNNMDKIITYVDPDSFTNLSSLDLVTKKGSLSEAVTTWLKYMGVANKVMTNDQGKIGHTLQISNDININQDLTNVGVGVSQVLPILVMALMAKKGDVIILEQPELHLHPKVQTRLADFFVAMNALGKQCLVETHSEYMINRLRYLVAVNDSSKVADETMIYFVEKEDGHSEYRSVTINKYGVIEDWPDGFFDESENLAAMILRAGMEKRMKEENDEEDDE